MLTLDEATITPGSRSDTQVIFTTPARDNGIASVKLSGNGPSVYAEFLYLPPALKDLPPGYITTVMGIGQFRGDGRLATNAMVDTEEPGFAIVKDGSLVFSEPNEFVMRHVRSDGVIERYAGTGVGGNPGDGGPAVKAVLSHPRGVALDAAGNCFIADAGGFNCIRRVDATTAVISTVYGKQGVFGFSGDGGPATQAVFNEPVQIAFDGKGNFYVLDSGNFRIRKIDANGIITTIAGTGVAGYSGDGGPAIQATFNDCRGDACGLAGDSQGNLYLADSANDCVRKIDGQTGIISTFVGGQQEVCAVVTDAADNVYVGNKNFTDPTSKRILKLSPSGQLLQSWGRGRDFSDDGAAAATAPVCNITRLALDHSGNILFGENCSSRIRRINVVTGLLETFAGMGPHIIGETGPALETVLNDPGTDLLFLPSGDLLTGEQSNNLIRKVDKDGNVQKFAGTGFRINFAYGQDGLPALVSSVYPVGLALAPNGDVLVDMGFITRIDTSGIIHGVTCPCAIGFSGDGGPASGAATGQSWGVTADADGNVLIADTNNNRVRRVDAQTGIIDTVTGSGPVNGGEGYGHGRYCGDGGPATQACLNTPYDVAVAPDGTMYISENFERIRKVTPDGIITTFFTPTFVGPGNKLALTPTNNLFMTPYRIESNGHSFQFAFTNQTSVGIGDGGPATQARFEGALQDSGIAVDAEGNLFFADPVGRRIRAVRFGAVLAEPGSIVSAASGTPQTGPVNITFPTSLQITLKSPVGTPENGIRVDFAAPSSGPSCMFPNGKTTYSVLTDINGHASAICTANSQTGSYAVTATPLTLGQSVSFSLTNTPALPNNRQPLNISTRMRVLKGDNVLIGGFIIMGTDPKKVIIRGIGPSLTRFGIQGALANPTLELHRGSTTLTTNDNWKLRPDGSSQQAEVEATTLQPTNDLESAIVATLDPGAYTAILVGKNQTSGVGIVEVYDLAQGANSKLANISSRGFVDTGDNVMIGGLIVGPGGSATAKVLIRAIGPSLAAFGVSGALQDPTLELHNGNGDLVLGNDNWKDSQQSEIQATGIPPNDDRESALVFTVTPGNYTAIVRGATNTTGIGLVEAYNLQ